MALRIRLPLLLDLLLVSDPEEVRELNEAADVDRVLPLGPHAINRRVARQVAKGLRFEGRLLPVLRLRGARSPSEERRRTTERWRAQRTRRAPLIHLLARHVAGYDIPRPVGVVAQELLGTLFDPDYCASPVLYADARRVRSWLGLRGVLGLGRRRLEGAQRRLHAAAKGDLACIHATAIAVHLLVGSLRQMRRLVEDDRMRTRLDAREAAARCLEPPALLLRSTRAPVPLSFRRTPLERGALIVLRLRRPPRRKGPAASPFVSGSWSECPALEVVPALLAEVWEARRSEAPVPAWRPSLFERLFEWTGEHLLGRFTWHKLPAKLGVVRLIGFRTRMRRENLIDTEAHATGRVPPPSASALAHRSADGSYNDVDRPGMGAAGRRFGRNLPPPRGAVPHHLDPNPRELSLALMTRTVFRPASTLNVLVAAWIQFMVHGWFNHARDSEDPMPIAVPPAPDDPWLGEPMRVVRTLPALRGPGESPAQPIFDNTETHWWDASQLYASRLADREKLRAHRRGHLLLPGGRLPRDAEAGRERSGFTDNWWVGLSLFHTLFALEHNAICDELARHHPGWSDDELFERARLVNAALLAKIHTLEWTPAILDHPALHETVQSTWWGFQRERSTKLFGRLTRCDLASGAPGSRQSHHGVDYALTEEFVAVYRMHQLLPDRFEFRSTRDDSPIGSASLAETLDAGAHREIDRVGIANAFYSFGRSHPGAIVLHNYPAALQKLERKGEPTVDLAAIDILRDRERGIPRYNEFRELVGLAPVGSFEELCEDAEEAKRVGEAYGGDLSKVDLQVGMAAERRPTGFGFGETAFRIFTVMAIRRLESDRFFTTDYTPETYTPEGLAWVEHNDLASVLRRHYPTLDVPLRGIVNPFAPWRRATPG